MSELVLYRKYRSNNFDEIIGQEHVVTTLKNAIISGSVGHAYLFSGSRGVGKTSVARILARAVNCTNLINGYNPCNTCDSCCAFKEQSSLDLVEIDAASHRGIDNIRFLQEGVGFVPTQAKKKIFIIDEVHMLTKEAFNALLKTLEEPPDHALFVLATTELNKVPDTIVSRCQHFNFIRVSRADIVSHLIVVAGKEGKKLDKKAAELVADGVGGSVRDGLSVLEQLLLVNSDEIVIGHVTKVLGLVEDDVIDKIFRLILEHDIRRTLTCYYEEVFDRGVDVKRFMAAWQVYLRRILLTKSGVNENDGGIENIGALINTKQVLRVMDILEEVMRNNYSIDSLYFEVFANKVINDSQVVIKKKVIETQGIKDDVTKVKIYNDDKGKKVTVTGKNEILSHQNNLINIDVDDVRQKWGEYVGLISVKKPVLGSMLKMADFKDVNSGKLIIDVPYVFHKEKLNDLANKQLLLSVFEEYFGHRVGLEIRVSQERTLVEEKKKMITEEINKKVDESTGQNLVKNVVEIFGGKVVSK